MERNIENIKKTIHYLQLLQKYSLLYQPEVRDAIDESVIIFEELLMFINLNNEIISEKQKDGFHGIL
jgi:hypothetical protein